MDDAVQFALVGNVVYFRDARVGNVKVPPLEDGVVGEQGVADDWTFPSLDCFECWAGSCGTLRTNEESMDWMESHGFENLVSFPFDRI